MAYPREVGDKINMLTILKIGDCFTNNGNWYREILCKCECGNIKIIRSYNLNRIKSCGCLLKTTGNIKHGLSRTRWQNIWNGMTQRCNNPKHDAYHRYGGRGIKCEWNNIEEFYEDMKEGYENHLTIDRRNNDKGYFKSNCRWATMKEQGINRRNYINPNVRKLIGINLKKITYYINRNFIIHNGIGKTEAEWCRYLGISAKVVSGRQSVMRWSKKESLGLIERVKCK